MLVDWRKHSCDKMTSDDRKDGLKGIKDWLTFLYDDSDGKISKSFKECLIKYEAKEEPFDGFEFENAHKDTPLSKVIAVYNAKAYRHRNEEFSILFIVTPFLWTVGNAQNVDTLVVFTMMWVIWLDDFLF